MKTHSIFKATAWKILEKFGSKGIQFVIQIILARILVPDDYGIVAILTVFISLSNVFIQNGFSTSLIQKKETTQADFCTALFTSMGIAALFYIILFAASPFIASFYAMEELSVYLRVQSLLLFAGSFNSVQYAYVSRKLNFRAYTIATLIASFISGAAGIFFAIKGFGVWSLIFQQLIANYLAVVILYMLVEWRLQLIFSIESLKTLFSYGWKILGSSLINSLYASMYNLIIGKIYTKEMLGLYSRGQQFPLLITDNLNETVQSVTLPVLSQMQDDAAGMKRRMKRALTLNAFVVFPAMLGLSAISHEFILVVLGEKWLAAVPYMMLLSLVYSMYPIHTMNIQCMKALGRSDLFLKLEIIKKILEITMVVITLRFGLTAMIFGQIVLSFVGIPINVWPAKKFIGYGVREQLKDLFPTMIAGGVMYGAVKLAALIPVGLLIKLILEVVIGAGVYVGLSFLLRNDAMMYLLDQWKEIK